MPKRKRDKREKHYPENYWLGNMNPTTPGWVHFIRKDRQIPDIWLAIPVEYSCEKTLSILRTSPSPQHVTQTLQK